MAQLPLLQRDPQTEGSIFFLWIPIDEGELDCCNCGNHWGGEMEACGQHAYCGLCRGRGRNEDHDCEEYRAPSTPFRRMEHDCPGCGERHQDWERCAEQVWALHQQAKAREQAETAGERDRLRADLAEERQRAGELESALESERALVGMLEEDEGRAKNGERIQRNRADAAAAEAAALRQRVATLEMALEYYAAREQWQQHTRFVQRDGYAYNEDYVPAGDDRGERARAALAPQPAGEIA